MSLQKTILRLSTSHLTLNKNNQAYNLYELLNTRELQIILLDTLPQTTPIRIISDPHLLSQKTSPSPLTTSAISKIKSLFKYHKITLEPSTETLYIKLIKILSSPPTQRYLVLITLSLCQLSLILLFSIHTPSINISNSIPPLHQPPSRILELYHQIAKLPLIIHSITLSETTLSLNGYTNTPTQTKDHLQQLAKEYHRSYTLNLIPISHP